MVNLRITPSRANKVISKWVRCITAVIMAAAEAAGAKRSGE